jgi:hypothetical protein
MLMRFTKGQPVCTRKISWAETLDSYKDYNASLFVGSGIKSKLFNSIYMITELAVGTNIVEGPFNGYLIKLKVGLGLK